MNSSNESPSPAKGEGRDAKEEEANASLYANGSDYLQRGPENVASLKYAEGCVDEIKIGAVSTSTNPFGSQMETAAYAMAARPAELPPSRPAETSLLETAAAFAPSQAAAGLIPQGTNYAQMATHPNATAAQAPSAQFLNSFLLNQMNSNQLMQNAPYVQPQVQPQYLPMQNNAQVQPQLLPASMQSLLEQLQLAPMAQQNQNMAAAGLQQAAQAPIVNQSYWTPTGTTTSPINPQDQTQLAQNLIQERLANNGQTNTLLLHHQQNLAALYNITQQPAATLSSQNMNMQGLANFPSSSPTYNQVTSPVLAATGAAYNSGIPQAAAAALALNSNTQNCLKGQPSYPQSSMLGGNCNGSVGGALPNEVLKRLTTGTCAVKGSKEHRWMIRYEELLGFHQKHGHCRVPHSYVENRKLSWWVMNQRAQYKLLKRGKKSWLTEERVMLLDVIGFEWNPVIGKSGRK